MKYIVVKDRDDKEYAILFPDQGIHKDVARIHRATDVRLVSAGFCQLDPVQVWGESESLNSQFKPRPEDVTVITRGFYEPRPRDDAESSN